MVRGIFIAFSDQLKVYQTLLGLGEKIGEKIFLTLGEIVVYSSVTMQCLSLYIHLAQMLLHWYFARKIWMLPATSVSKLFQKEIHFFLNILLICILCLLCRTASAWRELGVLQKRNSCMHSVQACVNYKRWHDNNRILLIHICRMDLFILIIWMSPFQILRFPFLFYFEIDIPAASDLGLHCLQCSKNGTLCLYGLRATWYP